MVPLLPPFGKAVRFLFGGEICSRPVRPFFLNPTRAAPAWRASHTTG